MNRWPVLLVVVALLVGAAAYERDNHEQPVDHPLPATSLAVPPAPEDAPDLLPVRAPDTALSSTWYCAGGTADAKGDAAHTVVAVNPGADAVRGDLTVFPSDGKPVTQSIRLPGRSRVKFKLADIVQAPYASAMLEARGGQVSVFHEVSGKLGASAGSCASSPSDQWFFSAGSTLRGADQTFVFFNPFPDDASVDVTFSTDQGVRSPAAFQGIVVPGRSVVAASVSDAVTIREVVAATVRTRAGRIIVDRLQSFDGTARADDGTADESTTTTTAPDGAEQATPIARKGLAVTLGAPSPATIWLFPDGRKQGGVEERYVIYNPTERTARVEVGVDLQDPRTNGTVDPIGRTIEPGGIEVVDLTTEDRVPDADHSVTITSPVPVVAERFTATAPPFPVASITLTLGSPVVATDWVLPSSADAARFAERIYFQNPQARTATVSVTSLVDGQVREVPGLQGIEVPAGSRTGANLDDEQLALDHVLIVHSDVPIAVEENQYVLGGLGAQELLGVPARSGVVLPRGATLPPG